MAYQNINFPSIKLLHDFSEEAVAPTTIISNFAKEYRINRFSSPKRRFTIPSRNITATDWDTLATFMTNVGYQRDSFNLIHPFSGTSIKVRFENIPTMTVISLFANNTRNIVAISDIILIEVFNE